MLRRVLAYQFDAPIKLARGQFLGREALLEAAVDDFADAAQVVADGVDLANDVVEELDVLVLIGGEVKGGDVASLAVAVGCAAPAAWGSTAPRSARRSGRRSGG